MRGALLAPDIALALAVAPLARRAAGPARAVVQLVSGGRARRSMQTTAWRGFTSLHNDGWAGPHVELTFDLPDGATGCELLFEGETLPEALPEPLTLTVSVPGGSPALVQVDGNAFSTRLPIAHLPPGRHHLTVDSNGFLVPHMRLGNGDYRPLSFRLVRLQVIPERRLG